MQDQLTSMNLVVDRSHEQKNYSTIAINTFQIDHKFYLDPNLLVYCLNIESSCPIDHVLIQSNCKIELIDVDQNQTIPSFKNLMANCVDEVCLFNN